MFDGDPTGGDSWRRWSLAGLGVVLFVVLLWISTVKPEPLLAGFIDLVYPLLLVLGVTASGVIAVRSGYSASEIWALTRWSVGVTVVFAGLSLWAVFLVLRVGGPMSLVVNGVTAVVATGAGIGIVFGEYDRRQRQAAARTELVKKAVEGAMEGVAILNADEEYVMVNQAHADLYGYEDPEDMVGETWRICYQGETLERFEDDVMPTLYENGVWRGEAEGARADGTTFPQELSLTTLDEGGLVCVVRDTTNRVEREQELRSTTTMLSTLVENIPVGILAEDSDRNVLFTNQEFCDIFEFDESPEELVGMDCEAGLARVEDLVVDSEQFVERTNDSVASGTPIDRESYDLVDGRTIERRATPVELDGEGAGHLWVYHDVTDQRTYERQLSALHQKTREMITAPSRAEIATLASDAASEILDLRLNGVHFYDGDVNALVPVSWSAEGERLVGEPPVFSPGDSVAWQTFESGEKQVFTDIRSADAVFNPETPIRSELQFPLGDHGVFLVGELTTEAFDQTDITLANLLATNVEATLDRAEREESLRSREDQLEAERDRFATLFDNVPDPALTVAFDDGESVVQSVNQAFEDVFGYAEENIVGCSLNELIVPSEFRAEAKRIDDRAAANEQLAREVRRQTADGELRDFLFRNVPIGSDGSESFGIYTDITDRKRRERTLEALNQVTRDQFKASTPERICELAVTAAQDVLEIPLAGIHLHDESEDSLPPTAVNSAVTDRMDEDDLTFTDPATVIWEVFDTGEIVRLPDFQSVPDDRIPDPETPVESAIVLPVGPHGVFVLSALEPHAFDDDDLRLAELLAATTAIALTRAEQNRMLERLHEATRELMSVTDEADIADLTLDAAITVLGFSQAAVRYLDASGDTLVPAAVSDTDRDTLDALAEIDDSDRLSWDALQTGEPQVVDDVTEWSAVEETDADIRSLLVLPLGEYGTLTIASVSVGAFDHTDVSLASILAANVETALDRAADERALRQRERALRKQNDQLEEFASVLSHDLRNPLNVAQGRLTFIDAPEHEEHLESIRRAHERMIVLIDDVLTLARQGQSVGDTTVVPIRRTATGAWRQVATGTATLDADVDLEIEADESRLQQLFENLFRNSVEHSSTSNRSAARSGDSVEHGGDAVTVRVDALEDGSGFYVADDGPGIPPGEREQVFDHGFSTAAEGTGFGLAIVQQIVRAHGWEISVTESEQGGARFEIRTAVPVGTGEE